MTLKLQKQPQLSVDESDKLGEGNDELRTAFRDSHSTVGLGEFGC
jgi:hypothetical protein